MPKQLLLPHQNMTILTKAEPKQDLPSSLYGTQLLSCSMLSHLDIGQWATGYPEVSVVSFASQKFGAIWMDVFVSNPYRELGIPNLVPKFGLRKLGRGRGRTSPGETRPRNTWKRFAVEWEMMGSGALKQNSQCLRSLSCWEFVFC